MPQLQLPADLTDFLRRGLELKYDVAKCDPGRIQLRHTDQLVLESVWIEPDRYCVEDSDDPHAKDGGLYEVKAVDLVREAEHFPPEFILLWVPDLSLYGTWDCDHYKLWVFPKASWSDIVLNPLPYINTQWYLPWREEVTVEVATELAPWEHFAFIPGRPDQEEE